MNLSPSAARRMGLIPRKAVTPAQRELAALQRGKYEDALAAQLERAGISVTRQFKFCDDRRFRADFAIFVSRPYALGTRFTKLLVEVDGGLFVAGRHSRGASREAEMERDALAMLAGWRVLRVSPRHVTNGKALAWIQEMVK